jgi:hypothetical protein
MSIFFGERKRKYARAGFLGYGWLVFRKFNSVHFGLIRLFKCGRVAWTKLLNVTG